LGFLVFKKTIFTSENRYFYAGTGTLVFRIQIKKILIETSLALNNNVDVCGVFGNTPFFRCFVRIVTKTLENVEVSITRYLGIKKRYSTPYFKLYTENNQTRSGNDKRLTMWSKCPFSLHLFTPFTPTSSFTPQKYTVLAFSLYNYSELDITEYLFSNLGSFHYFE
jgi:hypothetical protein